MWNALWSSRKAFGLRRVSHVDQWVKKAILQQSSFVLQKRIGETWEECSKEMENNQLLMVSAGIEERFEIKITENEFKKIKNLDDLNLMVVSKLSKV
jgi:hypothetical protein